MITKSINHKSCVFLIVLKLLLFITKNYYKYIRQPSFDKQDTNISSLKSV